jgi:hypothetical protein
MARSFSRRRPSNVAAYDDLTACRRATLSDLYESFLPEYAEAADLEDPDTDSSVREVDPNAGLGIANEVGWRGVNICKR